MNKSMPEGRAVGLRLVQMSLRAIGHARDVAAKIPEIIRMISTTKVILYAFQPSEPLGVNLLS